jgi:predicted amidohydrolase YtcJ
MPRRRITAAAFGLAIGAVAWLTAQEPPPARASGADVILTNGKVVTVDDRFSIAQAVAIEGDRILRVGRDSQIVSLASPSTRRIDLRGRTVIPGLIDNHMHLVRAGATWGREVRWDGVGTRKQALDLLRARVETTPAGEWIYNLGGWAVEQFADDSRPFSREELDRAAPAHPVFLQASYYAAYVNSRALESLGIAENAPEWVVRGTAGRPTGVIEEAGVRPLAARMPVAAGAELEASTRQLIRDMNKAGLTSFGSAGCEPDILPVFRRLSDQQALGVRVFCIVGGGAGSPQQVDGVMAQIRSMKLFQGGTDINQVSYGEGVYGPLHDPMFIPRSNPRPDQLAQWRRIVTEIAAARLPLHVHANLTDTIDAFLDQIEQVNSQHPIAGLRWTLAHVNQINAGQLARMKKLDIAAAVHPWAVINGGINRRVFGDAALDMAPLETIQKSGVTWGFGSDGSRANQILPFTTLWWAVTGKMVGGAKVLRQPIGREDALIAHTRRNAWFVFQEKNLGSIEAGKLADLVVLDRDYLTVPADDIKDIRPVMTIVGGRIAFEDGLPAQAGRRPEPEAAGPRPGALR